MTHTTPPTCARGIHRDGTRPPVIGKSQLCGRCHTQFRAAVQELGDLWPALTKSQVRSAAASGTTQRVQSSNRIEAGSLWRPQVTGALDEIGDWTRRLIRILAADPRNHVTRWPTDPQVILYAIARPDAARYLTHVHELAPAFVDDALSLRLRANSVLDSRYVRRYPLPTDATCRYEISDQWDGSDEHPCGAPLVATVELEDAGRDSAIRCTAHPTEHRIPVDQWAALADYLEELRG